MVFIIDDFIEDFKNMDYTKESLLGLSILSGGVTADLVMGGNYLWGAVFLVITGALVFVRGYFKVK